MRPHSISIKIYSHFWRTQFYCHRNEKNEHEHVVDGGITKNAAHTLRTSGKGHWEVEEMKGKIKTKKIEKKIEKILKNKSKNTVCSSSESNPSKEHKAFSIK